MFHIAKKIHHELEKAGNILIIPHQNPDGDSLGSSTALMEFLISRGKRPNLFCVTPASHRLCFLPHAHALSQDSALFKDADVIVILDSGDLRYAGVGHLVENHPAVIINIDHHPTNEYFGTYNWVLPDVSSTSEVLYHFFARLRAPINQNMATSLLTGILTDTDNFSNPATSATSLKAASELLRLGGDIRLVNKKISQNKTVDLLRLWGTAFSRLNKDETMNLVYTFITQADFVERRVNDDEAEGIANFLNGLGDARIALLLKETPDKKIKGSFRTTKDDVDVSIIAKKLGGGGHRKAAGFTAEGTIEQVLNRIMSMQI